MKPQAAPPSISVIVPIGARRAADVAALYREYRAGIAATGATHEFIFVLDGPRPEARRALEALLREGEEFTIVNLTRNFGEAAALTAGFERASGGTIVTLPAYPQIEPGDIRKLLAALSTADMAIGYRWPRSWQRARSRAARGVPRPRELRNGRASARSRLRRARDAAPGAGRDRSVRRPASLPADPGDAPRLPRQRGRRRGSRRRIATAGSIGRASTCITCSDLFSIFFLMRFTKKPLRFFGMLGAATFGVGAVLIGYLGLDRLLFSEPLADRPALLLAALLLVLGMQVFALGLLGELIIFTHARGLKDYRVEEIIQYPDAVAARFGQRLAAGADRCQPGNAHFRATRHHCLSAAVQRQRDAVEDPRGQPAGLRRRINHGHFRQTRGRRDDAVREEGVRLVDQHDVRPAQAIVERLQLHQQGIREHRPRLDGERRQVDGDARRRLIERTENLREPRHFVRVAEHLDFARHAHVADFRAHDAALVAARQELIEQPGAQRRLAGAVGSVHEHRVAARSDFHG